MPEYAIGGLLMGMLLSFAVEALLRPRIKKLWGISPHLLLCLLYFLVSAGVASLFFAAAMNGKDLLNNAPVGVWFTLMQTIALLFPSAMAATYLKAWGDEQKLKNEMDIAIINEVAKE